jgi:hypothetical protein
MSTVPAVPDGLSPQSGEVWTRLHGVYAFSEAEIVALTEHLHAQDRAAVLEAAGQVKLSQGERTLAHRWWRGLKFTSAGNQQRRPGRPSGDGWSDKRREAGAAHLERIAKARG